MAPLSPPRAGLDHLLDLLQVERAGRLTRRIVLHGHEKLARHLLHGHEHEGAVEEPVVIGVRVVLGALEGIAAQIEEQRHA